MREGAGPRPSSHATARLAGDVRDEVAELRGSLRAALDEAERLATEGHRDLAAAVLEEQRVALTHLHERLSQRIAGAAVEREAEHVVGVACTTPPSASLVPVRSVDAPPVTPPPSEGADAPSPSGDPVVLRLLASAAAAVVGIAILLSPGGHVLRVAGWTTVAPATGTPVVGASDAGLAEAVGGTSLAARRAPSDAVPPADRAITTEPSPVPTADPGTVAATEQLALLEVRDLVRRLAEDEDAPPTVGGTDRPPAAAPGPDEAPDGGPAPGPTPLPTAPTPEADEDEEPGTQGGQVPGADEQAGVTPDSGAVDGAVVADPTVERPGPAR